MKDGIKKYLNKLGIPIEHILFPPYCTICSELLSMEHWDENLCVKCRENLPFLSYEDCKNSIDGYTVFEEAIAAFDYEEVHSSIYRFKFKSAKKDGDGFGEVMALFLEKEKLQWLGSIEYMIPVPLHTKRLKQRGFNQSEEICKSLSKRIGIDYKSDRLYRIKHVKPQRILSAKQRKNNVKDIFLADNCEGHTILLIDDVFTTGTTVNECSRELYRKGAKEVYVFTLAMTR